MALDIRTTPVARPTPAASRAPAGSAAATSGAPTFKVNEPGSGSNTSQQTSATASHSSGKAGTDSAATRVPNSKPTASKSQAAADSTSTQSSSPDTPPASAANASAAPSADGSAAAPQAAEPVADQSNPPIPRGASAPRGTPKRGAAPAQVSTPAPSDGSTAQAEPVENFVATLAQSLHAGGAKNAPVAATPSDTQGASTDARPDTDDDAASAGQGDLALALVSQALAAALGLPAVTPPMASPSAGSATAQPSDSSSTAAAIDANAGQSAAPGGSPIQVLVSLLAADAAQSKAQNAPLAAQPDAAGNNAAGNNAAGGNAAGGSASSPVIDPGTAASAGPALAHMGIASHFSLQHSTADSNTLSGELRSAVGTPAWQDELGGQMTWMAHQGLESASLRLSPEHLGPLEVHISVRDGAASVWFGATQPDTRAALEQALPRLREMFATQGLTLSNSGVSHESPRNQSRPSPTPAVAAVAAVGSAEISATPLARLSLGLVDTYA